MPRNSKAYAPVPNEQILEETRLKIGIARTHLEGLGEFGITADWIDELAAAADEAEQLPTHAQQLSEQKSLTAAKDAALARCIQWGRKLRLRMNLAFDGKAAKGMQFPSKEFRDCDRNESKLIALMPSLIELARQHSPDLASAGQTSADITQGETLHSQLKAANETQEHYKFSRSATTSQRRQAFLNLYEKVLRLNQIGQMVYGTDTPQGRLFRSNWGSNKTTPQDTANDAPTPQNEPEDSVS